MKQTIEQREETRFVTLEDSCGWCHQSIRISTTFSKGDELSRHFEVPCEYCKQLNSRTLSKYSDEEIKKSAQQLHLDMQLGVIPSDYLHLLYVWYHDKGKGYPDTWQRLQDGLACELGLK